MAQLKIQLMNCKQIKINYKQNNCLKELCLNNDDSIEITNEMISFELSDDYELFFNDKMLETNEPLNVENNNFLQIFTCTKLAINNNTDEKVNLYLEGFFECYRIVLKANSMTNIKLINDDYEIKGNNSHYLNDCEVNKIKIPSDYSLIINQLKFIKVDIYYDGNYELDEDLMLKVTSDKQLNYYCLQALNQYHLIMQLPCNSEFILECNQEVIYALDGFVQPTNLFKFATKASYEIKISLKRYVKGCFKLNNPYLSSYHLQLNGYEHYDLALNSEDDYQVVINNLLAGDYEVSLSDSLYFDVPVKLSILNNDEFVFNYVGKVISFKNETKLKQTLLFYDGDEVKQILIMPNCIYTHQSLNSCLKVICVHPMVMMVHECEVIENDLDLNMVNAISLVMRSELVAIKGYKQVDENEWVELDEELCFTLVAPNFRQQYYLKNEGLFLSLNRDLCYEVCCDEAEVYINNCKGNMFYLSDEVIEIVINKKIAKGLVTFNNEDTCLIQLVNEYHNYVIDDSCNLEIMIGNYQLLSDNAWVIYHNEIYCHQDYINVDEGLMKVEKLIQVTLVSKEHCHFHLDNNCYEVPGIYYVKKGGYALTQPCYINDCLYHDEIYLDNNCIIDLDIKKVSLWIESDESRCIQLNDTCYCLQKGRQCLILEKGFYRLNNDFQGYLDGIKSNELCLYEDYHELLIKQVTIELSIALVKMIEGGVCKVNDNETYYFDLSNENNKFEIVLNQDNAYHAKINVPIGIYELSSDKACHLRLNQVDISNGFKLETDSNLLIIQAEIKQNLYLDLFIQESQSLYKPKNKDYLIYLENNGIVDKYQLNDTNNYQISITNLNQGMYRVYSDQELNYIVNGKDESSEAIISLQDEPCSVTLIERRKNKLTLKVKDEGIYDGHIEGMKISQDFILRDTKGFDNLENGVYVINFKQGVNYCLDQGSISDKGLVLMNDDEHLLEIIPSKVVLTIQKYDEIDGVRVKPKQASNFSLKQNDKVYQYELNKDNNYQLVINDLKGEYELISDDLCYLDGCLCQGVIKLNQQHILQIIKQEAYYLKISKKIRTINNELITPAAYDIYEVMLNDKQRVSLNEANGYEQTILLPKGNLKIEEVSNSDYAVSYLYHGYESSDLNINLVKDEEVVVINELQENKATIDIFQYILNPKGQYVAPKEGNYHFVIQNDNLKHEYVLNKDNNYHLELAEYVSGEYEIISLEENMKYLVNSPTLTNRAKFNLKPQSNLVVAIVEVLANNLVTLNIVKQVKGGKLDVNKSYVVNIYNEKFNERYILNKDNGFKLKLNLEKGIYMIEEIGVDDASFILDGVKLRKPRLVLDDREHECIVENKASLDIITLSL